jgi:RHS repeat-associated protein
MRHRAAISVAVSAVLLAVGATSASAIADLPDPTQLRVGEDTHQPFLVANIGTEAESRYTQFWAKTTGQPNWNLLNAAPVLSQAGGDVSVRLPSSIVGQSFEWQVRTCDALTDECSATVAGPAGRVSPMVGAGSRKGATTLPFQLGERLRAAVDVGTGNLLVTSTDLEVPAIGGDLPLGMAHNSLAIGSGGAQDAATSRAGWGWTQTIGWGTKLRAVPGGMALDGPSGLTVMLVPAGGGRYEAEGGLGSSLAQVTNGDWELTERATGKVWTFDDQSLDLVKIHDRNNNAITFTRASTTPGSAVTTVTGSLGLTAARSINVTTTSGRITGLSQSSSSGGPARSVTYAYNSAGDLTSITDASGRLTQFTYSGHRITRVDHPGGASTIFSYDTAYRVRSVSQTNTGQPTAVTSFSYGPTNTRVSDPSQHQQASPIVGERTTYTLTTDKTGRVSQAVDAEGRTRATTFTPNFDAATQTTGSGQNASVTTNTYNANNGESLTSRTIPTGATGQLAYEDPANPYLPTSATDDAGNSRTYTYNGAGNPLTGSDAMAASASLTYNANGTVSKATAPGNGTNGTRYYYSSGRLSSITPVTGSSLGAQSFTYDGFNRVASETDGRGLTTTYTYDATDHLLAIDYTSTTASPDISFTYDLEGRVTDRVDSSGTTTYDYDQLGRLTAREHSAVGGSVAYTYDKAGRLASVTDTRGTTTYDYDDAGELTRMTSGDGVLTTFAVDTHGRRTDTWMYPTETATRWSARSHTDYDASGRIVRILGESQADTGDPETFVDLSYSYSTTSGDRTFVQTRTDGYTGQETTYTYDGAGRLTEASVSTGYNPRNEQFMGAYTNEYEYDVRGNRTSRTYRYLSGSLVQRTETPSNTANQITAPGFTYDGAGNLTAAAGGYTSVAYNAGNQMTSVTRSAGTYHYTYAGAGNNELLTHTAHNTDYAYTYGRPGIAGKPVIEQVTVSGTDTAHLENDPTGQPILLRGSDGQAMLYIYDNLGSPVALLQHGVAPPIEVAYDPFGVHGWPGRSQPGDDEFPYTYTGGLYDRATGWILNGARYYSPAIGRWTQQDVYDAPLDPLNANRYAYAGNNPVNYVDPTGHNVRQCIQALAGEGIAVATFILTIGTGGSAMFALGLVGLTLTGLGVVESCDPDYFDR